MGMRDDRSTFQISADFEIVQLVIQSNSITLEIKIRRTGMQPHSWPPDNRKGGYLQDTKGHYRLLNASGDLSLRSIISPNETYKGSLTFERPKDNKFFLIHPYFKLEQALSLETKN